MSKKVIVIGAGIGGLGVAGLFAKKGYQVTVFEKNPLAGGRANIFEAGGFRFDMGPSWFLAPDLFEHFFSLMGESMDDHLELVRLSPSYRIFFAMMAIRLIFFPILSGTQSHLSKLKPVRVAGFAITWRRPNTSTRWRRATLCTKTTIQFLIFSTVG